MPCAASRRRCMATKRTRKTPRRTPARSCGPTRPRPRAPHIRSNATLPSRSTCLNNRERCAAMIELSFSKLLLLAVIALVVLGPEKLPKAARMAGAMMRRLRLGWESVRSEVERELELEEIRRAAKDAAARAESMRKAADDSVRSARASVSETVADLAKTAKAATVDAVSEEARDDDA